MKLTRQKLEAIERKLKERNPELCLCEGLPLLVEKLLKLAEEAERAVKTKKQIQEHLYEAEKFVVSPAGWGYITALRWVLGIR